VIGEKNSDNLQQGSGRRPGVLIVDDDAAVCGVVAVLLEHLGFTAFKAASGEEAHEVLSEHRTEIECVLLDALLPDTDGPAVLTALRTITPALRVVVMSGSLPADAAEQFRRLGARVHLQKPFGLSELSAALTASSP
jgi:two-component system cell cycle sensor histidine kinase/response regulator CckA